MLGEQAEPIVVAAGGVERPDDGDGLQRRIREGVGNLRGAGLTRRRVDPVRPAQLLEHRTANAATVGRHCGDGCRAHRRIGATQGEQRAVLRHGELAGSGGHRLERQPLHVAVSHRRGAQHRGESFVLHVGVAAPEEGHPLQRGGRHAPVAVLDQCDKMLLHHVHRGLTQPADGRRPNARVRVDQCGGEPRQAVGVLESSERMRRGDTNGRFRRPQV